MSGLVSDLSAAASAIAVVSQVASEATAMAAILDAAILAAGGDDGDAVRDAIMARVTVAAAAAVGDDLRATRRAMCVAACAPPAGITPIPEDQVARIVGVSRRSVQWWRAHARSHQDERGTHHWHVPDPADHDDAGEVDS